MSDKPRLFLSSGNAFAIIAACSKAAAKAGWSHDAWRTWSQKARSDTYESLLALVSDTFDVATGRGYSESPDDWRPADSIPEENE